MPKRIGFFICHRGINIAYRVREKEVAEYAATLPSAVLLHLTIQAVAMMFARKASSA